MIMALGLRYLMNYMERMVIIIARNQAYPHRNIDSPGRYQALPLSVCASR